MDHESLRTASTYLNNLLLARGLLRNSEPIDFVKPSKESRAQIINLVHDLILREDRGRDQREHVASTLRSLRGEDARKTHEIERLATKNEETARVLTQAQTAERTAKAEVKKVETAVKSLQEQAAKLKTTLAQVKTQCANDVRKRDLEVARLKTHLQGQQRGNRVGMTAPSITITGGARKTTVDASLHDIADPEYSLKQETTEFLTQLSQSLSDENDNLITLMRGALTTMRELLGLPADARHPDSAIGSMGSYDEAKHGGPTMLHPLPTSYETLAADMDATLGHLKTILTNPNFVSVEEVEVREEEIVRLREGWERMEQRWKEVLRMMEGWRRKMDTGLEINVEDLRQGMGLVSPEHLKSGLRGEDFESSLVNGDVSEIELSGGEQDSSLLLERPRSDGPAVALSSSPKRKRDVLEPPAFFDLRPSSSKPAAACSGPDLGAELHNEFDDESDEREDVFPCMTIAEKLDIARVEAEEAATSKVRSTATAATSFKSKLPRSTNGETKRIVSFSNALDGAADDDDDNIGEKDDTLGRMSPVAKRTKIRGRPKRRKSTLSPEELEELIRSTEG